MIQAKQTADWKKTLSWLALALGLLAMFSHVVFKMWSGWFQAWYRADLGLYHRFTDGDSYYTHGPLVLLVGVALLVFLVRRAKIAVRPEAFWGNVSVASAMLLYLAGCVIGTTVIRGTAWIALLAAIVLRFWGFGAIKKLWFPIAFLFFMVPLPMWIISDVNLALKMAATDWAVRLANFMGIMAEHNGAQILLDDDKTLVVGNICSGLRTLISLLAFGAAYTFVCRLRGWWRVGLFAMTVPVALVANCVRIAGIIVVAHFWDVPTATGAYHDDSGLVVFVLAFLMMFGLEKLVLSAHRWAGRPLKVEPLFAGLLPKGDRSQSRAMFLEAGVKTLLFLAAAGVFCGWASWWLDRAPRSIWTSNVAAKSLPDKLTVRGRELTGADMTLTEDVLTLLNTRDYLYRQYVGLDQPVDVCVIFSKDNPTSSHPPELCLTAGGGDPYLSGGVALGGIEGMPDVSCRELAVRQGRASQYFIYTFKYGDSYTARFGWQQVLLFFRTRLIGNASGALVRVSTPITTDVNEARQRAMDVARVAMPYLDKGLK